MKKILNRTFSAMLALLMCVSLLNLTVFAADESTETPPVETQTVEEHTHNSTVTKDGKTYQWNCVPSQGETSACTLTEHVHAVDDLTCTKEAHIHTDECYTETEVQVEVPSVDEDGNPILDEDGNPVVETVTETRCELTCEKEAHTHDGDCYGTCALTEHVHANSTNYPGYSNGYGVACNSVVSVTWTCVKNEVTEDEKKEGEADLDKLDDQDRGNINQDRDKVKDKITGDGWSSSKVETDKDNIYLYVKQMDMQNGQVLNTSSFVSIGSFVPVDANGNKVNDVDVGALTQKELVNYINNAIKYKTITGANGKELTTQDYKDLEGAVWTYVRAAQGTNGVKLSDKHDNRWITTHANAHLHIDRNLVHTHHDATCTADAYDEITCRFCSYKVTKTQTGSALGHDWSGATQIPGNDAQHKLTCNRCHATDVEKLVGHTWASNTVEWSAWTAAEALNGVPREQRTGTYVCSECGYVKNVTEYRLKGQVTVTVNYVCGDETLATVSQSGYPGFSYTTEIKEFPGYTTTETSSTSTINEDTTITIPYTKVEYTLTVIHSYLNEAGSAEVAQQTVNSDVKYHVGDAYSTSSLARTGYRLSSTPSNASGTFGAGNITVTYVYRATPTPPPTPSPTPSESQQVIEDPEVPLVEEPDLEIDEPELPLVEEPEIEIDEPDIPLADVPQTGDESLFWTFCAVTSGAGLLFLALMDRKRRSAEK